MEDSSKDIIGEKTSSAEWLEILELIEKPKKFNRKDNLSANNLPYLESLNLNYLTITKRCFEGLEFKNCSFKNCHFTQCIFTSAILKNVKFISCTLSWSKFIEVDLIDVKFLNCSIDGLELTDILTENVEFIDCSEILDLQIRGFQKKRKFNFINCFFHCLVIDHVSNSEGEIFNFYECLITESSFDRIDLTNSQFANCSLSLNRFTGCKIKQSTFEKDVNVPASEYNFIDFRTILDSEKIALDQLESLFGINSPDVKDYLSDMTSAIEYQSIFVSYSLKDKDFANAINAQLIKRGIFTFLFERDSTAGKSLRSIMSEGVKQKDRVLFIASENSLKSEACQYELSQGRLKQESLWEEVLFPIHIDSFLFEVQFDQIRPIDKRDEYWKNIQELRATNSQSFIEFANTENPNDLNFEKQVLKLIKGLRKS